ncbi:MAG: glycerophosphodiester phosphodiesterase [Myxococcota bacterium]|jgi:glycerophosphoryl diester phosphodiesterase|nr:glycerophosphodiester phosphodiesterase [Myxococcota bacterium]
MTRSASLGSSSIHPFLQHDGILAFAHRGDQDSGPENTLVAFEGAVRLGFRYLETDLQSTRDGVLLVFHDARLDRVTDQQGRIDRLDWATVRRARVGGTEPIARFEELLGEFPQVRVNIDPKSDAAMELLVDAIRRTGSEGRVCVGCFSDRRLKRFRAALPGVCTSMGRSEATRARLHSLGWPLPPGGAACAQVPVGWHGLPLVDARFVAAMRQRGLQVHVWTVNEPEQMHRLLDLGVDGLMTDRPAVLKEVLAQRGLWHDSASP